MFGTDADIDVDVDVDVDVDARSCQSIPSAIPKCCSQIKGRAGQYQKVHDYYIVLQDHSRNWYVVRRDDRRVSNRG